MKIGVSTYSLHKSLENGDMTVPSAIRWMAERGAQHVELVPIGFTLQQNPSLIEEIREQATKSNIDISNYAVRGNLIAKDSAQYEKAIQELQAQVDIAHQLGVHLLRHDVAWRPIPETGITQFEEDLPGIVTACQRIADYAAEFHITTSVENHGFFVQASDRVSRLVELVNRPNFRTTIDVGNFLCVDEDPVAAVKKNLPLASMIHLKDFYVRKSSSVLGRGFFETVGGHFLRGAILGHGDIDLPAVMHEIVKSGYDGYLSVEFEGIEDGQMGTEISLQNAFTLARSEER